MIFKNLELLKIEIEKLKENGKTIIWTNGCFDIIHPGHIEIFKKCKKLGDILVLGLNGDKSPYWITKPGRPINNEYFRSKVLESIKYIDYIYIYDDDTPVEPVNLLKPNFVVKGGDYIQESIKDFVIYKNGIYDLTDAYKNIILKGEENYNKEKGFMPEGVVNVKNGGKVVVIPTLKSYSTTNIINKILETYKK